MANALTHVGVLEKLPDNDKATIDRFQRIMQGAERTAMPAMISKDSSLEEITERLWNSIPAPLRGPHVMDLLDEAARMKRDLLRGRVKIRMVDGEPVETLEPTAAADRAAFIRMCDALGISPQARLRMAAAVTRLETQAVDTRFDDVLDADVEE